MMLRTISKTLFLVLLGFSTCVYAGDTSFRCGSNLISVGDTMHEVRGSCGEPYSSRIVGEKKTVKLINGEERLVESVTYLTEWVYESYNGIYVLTFEGSRVGKKEFIYQR